MAGPPSLPATFRCLFYAFSFKRACLREGLAWSYPTATQHYHLGSNSLPEASRACTAQGKLKARSQAAPVLCGALICSLAGSSMLWPGGLWAGLCVPTAQKQSPDPQEVRGGRGHTENPGPYEDPLTPGCCP